MSTASPSDASWIPQPRQCDCSLFTLHFSLFTQKKKPLCPPRYRWISPGTQKKEEQKALNPPHRDFSECKFITFSPNVKETKPKIAHYIYLTLFANSLSIEWSIFIFVFKFLSSFLCVNMIFLVISSLIVLI